MLNVFHKLELKCMLYQFSTSQNLPIFARYIFAIYNNTIKYKTLHTVVFVFPFPVYVYVPSNNNNSPTRDLVRIKTRQSELN